MSGLLPHREFRIATPEEELEGMLNSIKRAVGNLAPGETLMITRHDPKRHEHRWWFEMTKLPASSRVHHPPAAPLSECTCEPGGPDDIRHDEGCPCRA